MTGTRGKSNTGGSRGGRGRPGGARRGGSSARSQRPNRSAPQASSSKPDIDVHDPDGVRLQKLLAAAGVGSRRVCEDLITQGRVEVDGQVVRELGVRIDPLRQSVHVDGDRVQLDESRVYLAFNKPLGIVSTMNDELGRPSVGDYLEQRKDRLFHVGRLDQDTEGLLLLTNDGELANRLQHPSYGVPKTYVAMVPGPVPRALGKQLRDGVELEDGKVAVDSFKVVDSTPGWALIEVVLHEGRKHIVRRMLEAVGHPVESLTRTDVGPVRLGDLRPGKMRPLTKQEVAGLYKAAGL
ncbi:pseudouridine synthase [Flexivirga meconopsidis]|uniref:pseudouridine synthase n=1 Tax=Flexivirga meconopsidis TaxID=2977121 RepID=UPI00223ECEDE|nr:pseudouridine synthase [Flexivirga meconopsidis]